MACLASSLKYYCGNTRLAAIKIGDLKHSTKLYLRKHESPSVINLNKIIRKNIPIVALFHIWDLRTHKIQAIVTGYYIGWES